MVAHANGVVLAPPEVEAFGSLGHWREQSVHVRDRTVVEIGRRRPDPVEGTDLVGERILDAIGPVTVEGFPFLLRNRRILGVIPICHDLRDQLAESWTELLPELGQQPSDIVVTKRSCGAFATTDLDAHFRAKSVTQVVVAGVSTSVGVETTARQAYEQGFNVTLALDAMTDGSIEAHEHSVRNIFPRLGETGTTREIISLLMQRSAIA